VVGHPYPVSGLSAAVAMSVLADDGRARDEAIERVKRERSRLEAFLADRGAACVPSQANFVFARFGPRAEAIRRGLAEHGIGVRGFGEDRVIAEYLRITCPGDEAAFGRLLEGLAMAMSEVSKQ
jgi:histidinol-phosphate/aromatic aminotransferase/cobyric acid decarboxylase-like protein